MSYVALIDHDGHRYGPDAPEIADAVRQTDATLARFFQAALVWFDAAHPSGRDELYFIVTTDHGMEPVHSLVNLQRLIGADLLKDARIVTSGPVASVYLDQIPAESREDRAKQIVVKFRTSSFVSAWRAGEVPRALHYADPTRIGEVVVSLAPGYSWTSDRTATTRPASAGPRGMHGYDAAICPNMLGTAIIWRYRRPIGGRDLGPVDNTQWHATVAKLLGIERAKGSDSRAIKLP
jgi:predicted AlkP superfamily pyrophosphatase or phosphodiesterase